ERRIPCWPAISAARRMTRRNEGENHERLCNDIACGRRARIAGARTERQPDARAEGLSSLRTVPLARARPQQDRAKPRKSLGSQGGRLAELRTLLRCPQVVRNHLGRPLARRLVDRSAADGAG